GAGRREPWPTLDTAGRGIYVGSFSKTMLPTLRLGFVVAPAAIRDAVQRAKYLADWHSSLAAQAALARFIEDGGFARHIRKMEGGYEARHELVVRPPATAFARRLETVPSAVGLHVAALAPRASVATIDRVVRRASARGVEVLPLSMFSLRRPLAGLVIGYGAIATA